MSTVGLESESPGATERIARALAAGLEPGDVVLVSGDVGTGKTTFVRGACRALGVSGTVSSPSFTIGHRYHGDLAVAHVDLFRLDSLDDEDPGLIDDYVDAGTVTFVEWPDAALPALAGDAALRVRILHRGGDRRRLELEAGPALLSRIGG